MDSGDVVIIGAGLIGLSLAFELADRGATVRVFDKGEPGKAASWAGAGMLAPHTENIEDDVLLKLCVRSLEMYPAYVRSIHQESGIDPQLQLDGILSVAFDTNALHELRERVKRLRLRGAMCEILNRKQTLALEPGIGKHTVGAMLVRGEGQVDNRRLGRALLVACEERGVHIKTNVAELAVECDARRVLGVRTDRGFVAADSVVNATGAWAAQLAGVPSQYVPRVRPVKGQMLAIEIPRGFMRRVAWVPSAYLVPRADGRLLVGATVEEAGFDTRATVAGMRTLLHAAIEAAPALRDFTVSEMWAGLRPATPNERPFLGSTKLAGYFLATGHYRNGILLAPITATLLADEIQGKGPGLAFSNLAS